MLVLLDALEVGVHVCEGKILEIEDLGDLLKSVGLLGALPFEEVLDCLGAVPQADQYGIDPLAVFLCVKSILDADEDAGADFRAGHCQCLCDFAYVRPPLA